MKTLENIQSTLGNIQSTLGNIQSSLGNIQYLAQMDCSRRRKAPSDMSSSADENFREHSVNLREHSVKFREHSVNFREHSVPGADGLLQTQKGALRHVKFGG
jgi:hypothetical protein